MLSSLYKVNGLIYYGISITQVLGQKLDLGQENEK